MNIKLLLPILIAFFLSTTVFGQEVSLYQQFNGRYDFLFFGNSMNSAENNTNPVCDINTSSFATLNLAPDNQIHKAYLYWAGIGTGDFNVRLNAQPIAAERTFAYFGGSNDLDYFSAFADVTSIVQSGGNGVYSFTDLDLRSLLPIPTPNYCSNRTNFAGWAIVVIYKNDLLPPNQLNLYDGLQAIPEDVTIILNDINVIDTADSKIGFVAFEGDRGLSAGERLLINNFEVGNPPLNPPTNTFNGTNSFTGQENLYNMDLDFYDIADYIRVGDTIAEVKLTSGADFVFISTIVTKLNTILPDAKSRIDNYVSVCGSRQITVDYTILNTEGTDVLPARTPITFYVDGIAIGLSETAIPIAFEDSWSGQIILTIPQNIPDDFTLTIVADDNNGVGIIAEIAEDNNAATLPIRLRSLPQFNTVSGPIVCNEGLRSGTFDLSIYVELLKSNSDDQILLYETLENAQNNEQPISNPANYYADATPKTLFIRSNNEFCTNFTTVILNVRNCPPTIYNYISANNDGINDQFFIEGLRDIFESFELEIYNRWGVLLWKGNNTVPDWDGKATQGLVVDGNYVPDGTYYYVLKLNDGDYPNPLTGFLYINR